MSTLALTQKRRQTIEKAVKKYMNGELSQADALKKSKEEGYFAARKYSKAENSGEKNQKIQLIEKKFFLLATELRLIESGIQLNKLNSKNPDDKDFGADVYKFYGNYNFENKCFKVTTVISKITDSEFRLTRTLVDKLGENKTTTVTRTVINKNLAMHFYTFQNLKEDLQIPTEFQDNPIIQAYLTNKPKLEYNAIAFSSGGAKGVSYTGVVEGLGDVRLNKIKKVAGASAGAITATLLALGMKAHEFGEFIATANPANSKQSLELMLNTKIKELVTRVVGSKSELLTLEGKVELNDRELSVYQTLTNFEQSDFRLTFAHLRLLAKLYPDANLKTLYLNVSAKVNNRLIEIPLDYESCPNMPITTAAVASATVTINLPILGSALAAATGFWPVKANSYLSEYLTANSIRGDVYLIDGGFSNNLPYQKFSENDTVLKVSPCLYEDLDVRSTLFKESFTENHLMYGTPVYAFKRFESAKDKIYGRPIVYIHNGHIGGTDFKKAVREYVSLSKKAREELIDEECKHLFSNRTAKLTLAKSDNEKKSHDFIKYNLTGRLYNDLNKFKKALNDFRKDQNVVVNESDEKNPYLNTMHILFQFNLKQLEDFNKYLFNYQLSIFESIQNIFIGDK